MVRLRSGAGCRAPRRENVGHVGGGAGTVDVSRDRWARKAVPHYPVGKPCSVGGEVCDPLARRWDPRRQLVVGQHECREVEALRDGLCDGGNPGGCTPSSVAVAVMTAVCGPLRVKSAVIKPVVLKRGTAAELDAQMKLVMVVNSCPRASSAIASSCIDRPKVRTGVGADTCTLARRRCTVTVTLDCDDPADAPMMAVPSPTAVTVAVAPVPVTVATAGLLVVHANVVTGDCASAVANGRGHGTGVARGGIASVDEMVRLTDPFSGLVVPSGRRRTRQAGSIKKQRG